MPYFSPTAITACHIASPSPHGTLISYDSSPVKLMRNTRASMPATIASRTLMNGKAFRSNAGASSAISSRALGPASAMVAHCSVTEVQ